jgi:hypothetical protein
VVEGGAPETGVRGGGAAPTPCTEAAMGSGRCGIIFEMVDAGFGWRKEIGIFLKNKIYRLP